MIELREAADGLAAISLVATALIVRPWRWLSALRRRERDAVLGEVAATVRAAVEPVAKRLEHVADRQEQHIADHRVGDARLERVEDRLERVEDRQVTIAVALGVPGRRDGDQTRHHQPDDPPPAEPAP